MIGREWHGYVNKQGYMGVLYRTIPAHRMLRGCCLILMLYLKNY
jgi:hypothetical protein